MCYNIETKDWEPNWMQYYILFYVNQIEKSQDSIVIQSIWVIIQALIIHDWGIQDSLIESKLNKLKLSKYSLMLNWFPWHDHEYYVIV